LLGFQYEIDLWLSQAQLRHNKKNTTTYTVNDFTEALKCYLYAKEASEHVGKSISPHILGNISNLYYLIGNYDRSLDYLKQTFSKLKRDSSSSSSTLDLSLLYNNSDFESFYYDWKKASPVCHVLQDANDSNKFLIHSSSPKDGENEELPLEEALFQVGEEILIEDMVWIIDSFNSTSKELICHNSYSSSYLYQPIHKLQEMKRQFEKEKEKNKSFQLPSLNEMLEILSNEPLLLPVYNKEKWNNFNDETLLYSYNLARMYEDLGNVSSAMILYQMIVTLHPSHKDCK
jgi:tetratricopeptide (TPR) repeat protein